jgi:hypothetical protein
VFTEPLFEKDGTKFYGVRFRSDINSKQFDRRFGSYLGLPDEFKDEAMQRLCDAYGVKFIKLPPNPEGVTSKEFIEGIKPARPRVEAVPCTTQGCTPKIVTTQAQNSPPTNTSFQSTPRTGLFRGFFRGVFNTGPFTPGGIAERGLGLWEGSEEVIEYIRNNRRELGTMATTYMGLAKYYSGYAGKVVISYAPTAGTTVGLGSAAIAPAAISLANLEYSQSQINAAKANGGFIPISGPVQTAGPNSIWVYGRVYAGPNGQLYQATSWGFSPVYNTYSDWWNGTQATAKR